MDIGMDIQQKLYKELHLQTETSLELLLQIESLKERVKKLEEENKKLREKMKGLREYSCGICSFDGLVQETNDYTRCPNCGTL